ncbi:Zinc finger TFIIS-type [Trinorchestia longiramus]|nr:Zinc finger TFIIS-type [Trinorchestia longiramus]
MHFACDWCPYIYQIKKPVMHTFYPPKKPLDDVLGGKEAWKNVDSTEASCAKCSHNRAYFMQLQTRSADEPMTTYYKCAECGFIWKE